MKNVSPCESEGRLEVGRGEDLLAHDARLEPGRVLLHRVEDQVGVLLPEVLKDDKSRRGSMGRKLTCCETTKPIHEIIAP